MLVFFIGYILVEIPSNMAIRLVGPSAWISTITVCWGLVSIGLAFSQSWISVAVCRAILGALEGVSDCEIYEESRLTTLLTGLPPWLRLSNQLVVHPKRDPETSRGLLPPGRSSLSIWHHLRIWSHSNRKTYFLQGLALDLHR